MTTEVAANLRTISDRIARFKAASSLSFIFTFTEEEIESSGSLSIVRTAPAGSVLIFDVRERFVENLQYLNWNRNWIGWNSLHVVVICRPDQMDKVGNFPDLWTCRTWTFLR